MDKTDALKNVGSRREYMEREPQCDIVLAMGGQLRLNAPPWMLRVAFLPCIPGCQPGRSRVLLSTFSANASAGSAQMSLRAHGAEYHLLCCDLDSMEPQDVIFVPPPLHIFHLGNCRGRPDTMGIRI